jgi:site-specific recombinase XerD
MTDEEHIPVPSCGHGPRRLPLAASLLRAAPARLNRSDNTIVSYLDGARQAEAFLATRGRTPHRRPPRRPGGLPRRTAHPPLGQHRRHRHKALRILYRWLQEEDEINQNPMARVKPPIVPEQPVPVVPEDRLRRLLAACAGKTFDDRRDTEISSCS